MHILSPITGLRLLFHPAAADAAAPRAIVEGILNNVGSVLPNTSMAGGTASVYESIAVYLVDLLLPLLAFVAAIMIMYAGYRMVIGQDDNAKEKAKQILNMSIVGLILAYLIPDFIVAFYGAGTTTTGDPAVLSATILSIIDAFLNLAAVLAILMIIVAGFKAVVSFGTEEGGQAMRKALISVGLGVLVLALRTLLTMVFTAQTGPEALVTKAAAILTYILGFVGALAVGILVYAGILYITSFGKDEQAQKAKSMIFRSLAGIVVIILSVAIIRLVDQLITG